MKKLTAIEGGAVNPFATITAHLAKVKRALPDARYYYANIAELTLLLNEITRLRTIEGAARAFRNADHLDYEAEERAYTALCDALDGEVV